MRSPHRRSGQRRAAACCCAWTSLHLSGFSPGTRRPPVASTPSGRDAAPARPLLTVFSTPPQSRLIRAHPRETSLRLRSPRARGVILGAMRRVTRRSLRPGRHRRTARRGRARAADKEGTSGPDRIVGTSGADRLAGKAGRDVLIGKGGRDVLIGDSGGDRLYGGRGRDTLLGGSSNDRLVGGPGRDVISCGAGRDTVVRGPGDSRVVRLRAHHEWLTPPGSPRSCCWSTTTRASGGPSAPGSGSRGSRWCPPRAAEPRSPPSSRSSRP